MGDENHTTKHSKDDVSNMIKLREDGLSYTDIAKLYNSSYKHVSILINYGSYRAYAIAVGRAKTYSA